METRDKFNLVVRLLDDIVYGWQMDGLDDTATELLKVFERSFGTRRMSEMITRHPHAGYMIRYLDDMAPKLVAQTHEENICKNEIIIKEALS